MTKKSYLPVPRAESESYGAPGLLLPATIATELVRLVQLLLISFVRAYFRMLGSQCVYDPKSKPGLRTGAVEALSRRLGVAHRFPELSETRLLILLSCTREPPA